MPREELISLLVNWLPLVVLLVAWVFFMRRAIRHNKAHVAEVNQVNAEILAVNREMLAELREIKVALRDGQAR